MKLLAVLRQQTVVPLHDENGVGVKLGNTVSVVERKRKMLVVDEQNELMLHCFFAPHEKHKYKSERDSFESQSRTDLFRYPRFACEKKFGRLLVVAEEKVTGVSLEDSHQDVVEKFLDSFIGDTQKNWPAASKAYDGEAIHKILHIATVRLKESLATTSPFFVLYAICGNPYDNKKGYWPSQSCHGQALPVNILYNNKKGHFCFIDFEPELMGRGPYAYDFCFFVLYSMNLISESYVEKLRAMLSREHGRYEWARHFLAQIVWWSCNRGLDSGQLSKIEARSRIALSLIDVTRE